MVERTGVLSERQAVTFVPTSDADRARAFYEDILGLHFMGDDQYALTFDLGGATLRAVRMRDFTPARYTVLGWQVVDIREVVSTLTSEGVVFERYEGIEQDDLGIWTPSEGIGVAWFKDPGGNILSLNT